MRDYVKELRALAGYSGFQFHISDMLNGAANDLEEKTTRINELESKNMNAKWYVRCNSAEEDEYYVVQLTEDEYKAVVKFINNADYISGGCHCGACHIINHGFDTREEAVDAILNDTVWLYSE